MVKGIVRLAEHAATKLAGTFRAINCPAQDATPMWGLLDFVSALLALHGRLLSTHGSLADSKSEVVTIFDPFWDHF